MNIKKEAIRASLPVMAGYVVLGMGFGMILKSNGYGIGWAFLMSVFIYAGSMQYLCIELIASGASLFTFAISTLLVNARHLFYGISMIDKYRTAKKKPYLIFALTDETYSLVCNDVPGETREEKEKFYFLVSLFDQCYWVLGSLIGSALGYVLKISTEGMDFVLTALFLVIVTDQWLKTKKHLPAIIGFVTSVLCLVSFGSDSFLIPTMIAITVCLFAMMKFEKKAPEREEEKNE